MSHIVKAGHWFARWNKQIERWELVSTRRFATQYINVAYAEKAASEIAKLHPELPVTAEDEPGHD